MAMIYDMATGEVITGHDSANETLHPENIPAPALALQTIQDSTPVEDMAPVDAYMVMLQELLKKL